MKITKPDSMLLNESVYFGFDSVLHLNNGVIVQWMYNGFYNEGVLWMLLNEIIQYGLLEDTSFHGSNEAPPYIPPPAPSSGTYSFDNYPPTFSVNNYYAPCVQISTPIPASAHTHLKSKSVTRRCKRGTSSRFECMFKNCDAAFGRTNNRASHHRVHLQNYHYNGTCPVCGTKLKDEIHSLLQHIARKHKKEWEP